VFTLPQLVEAIGQEDLAEFIVDDETIATRREKRTMKKYKHEDFDVVGFLGQGSFGSVQLVKTKEPENDDSLPAEYALKHMSKEYINNSGQVEHTLDERAIVIKLAHPNVLRVYSTFQSKDELFILSECVLRNKDNASATALRNANANFIESLSNLLSRRYIAGCDLWALIHSDAAKTGEVYGLPPHFVKFYSANIVEGLGHIHSKGIAYRDLKPENVMVDADGYLKIIDFGFAKKIPYTVEIDDSTQFMPKSHTMCGTPEYERMREERGERSERKGSVCFCGGSGRARGRERSECKEGAAFFSQQKRARAKKVRPSSRSRSGLAQRRRVLLRRKEARPSRRQPCA
jgi:hypothetical protein